MSRSRRPRSLRSLLTRFSVATYALFFASVSVGAVILYRTWMTWEASVIDRTSRWVSATLAHEAHMADDDVEECAFSIEAESFLGARRTAGMERRLAAEERAFLERRGYALLMLFDAARAPRYELTLGRTASRLPPIPRRLFASLDSVGAVGGYLRLGGVLYRIGASALRDTRGGRHGGYLLLAAPVDAWFLNSLNQDIALPLRLSLDTLGPAPVTRSAQGDSIILREALHDIFGVPAGTVRTAFGRNAERLHERLGIMLFALLLLGGAAASGLAWYLGQRLLVEPLRQTVRDLEAMRGADARHELATGLPIAEWEVLRTAFNETVRSLSEFERRYRDVFDRAADALFILDPRTGRVVDANPASTALTGIAATEIIGQTLPAELNPGGPGQRVVQWRRGTEQRQTWGVAASEIAFDGGTCILAAYRDLTGREAMAHAQKMEAVGSLAGGIAHDFNNMMGIVLTGVRAARSLVGGRHPSNVALDGIEHAGVRAAELTRQLLSFSRHDPLRLAPVEVGRVIGTVRAMCARTFDRRIIVDAVIEADIPAVLGDAAEIEQALLNLCINARDAMRHGGSLRLEARRRQFDAPEACRAGVPQAGTYAEITVGDTGEGMTDTVKAHLFEPFFTTKDQGHGTGLGLSLVYGLTRQMGGATHVDSVVGRGTRVQLLFPAITERHDRHRTPAAAAAAVSSATPDARRDSSGPGISPTAEAPGVGPGTPSTDYGPVILLVDDERELREMLGMVLDLSGFAVLEAADGAEALAQFEEHRSRIRAILLDVQLPGEFGGVETLERIRAVDADVPVVLCTGFVREDDLARMRMLSVDDVLLKPVDINAMLARLHAICRAPRATPAPP